MIRKVRPAENAQRLPFPLTNDEIADRLNEIAELLSAKAANPFRVRAYREAAITVRRFERSISQIVESGQIGDLVMLPGIGESMAATIEQLAETGRSGLIDQLRGRVPHPQARLLRTVAGVGETMASRIQERLGIDTLEGLEAAAYDGRLNTIPGIGQKRLRAVRESLAGRFQRYPRPAESNVRPEPPVSVLLAIDAEYRRRAKLGQLRQIAPRRFNPDGKFLLPILRTRREGDRYTAMFSNTPLAHESGATRDWVVIFRQGDSRQWTVVTDQRAARGSRRVVRGRELECDAQTDVAPDGPGLGKTAGKTKAAQ